ncbi:spore cortex biosynthesis protein YabQ [Peribacillus deserti]|uniref:Spore cortex biosynthesis protein YabQ n=1 Tax=Peribacillus deserti TaxID=673318 RepID=A0ABS2QN14_9BACI|nr:spore cortex biosynthesis protein YabQ [Peribacillus deserti]MBM7694552.1 spore cortex biosynthesis protein YabQ [Peribacillus deserti]
MTLTTQFYTLLSIIGMGCCFGAALDTYNIFLNRSKRSSWVVFINDFLFWIIQGLITFYVLFLVNEGELRFYLFLALVCGFAAYQALLKNFYLQLLQAWISLVRKIYSFFIRMVTILLVKPLHWLVFALIAILLSFGKGLFFLAKFILKPLLSIIKGLLKPFFWMAEKLVKWLPKSVTSRFRSLFNKISGFIQAIHRKWFRWTKRTKD